MKKLSTMITAFVLLASAVVAQGYKVGDKATDFKLKNVDGKMVSMTDYNTAKGFVVVFTCNHCPFSKAYESRILDLDKKYASLGYPVIAINPNDVKREPEDSFENMQALAKEKNYTFPYLHDESQEVAKTYGATRTPHVYVVVKSGNDYVVKYIGAIDDNSDDAAMVTKKYVENALDELIAAKSVGVAETKAIGCTIKWKQQ